MFRRIPIALAAGSVLLMFAAVPGCVPDRPQPDVIQMASALTLTSNPIAFATHGGLLNDITQPDEVLTLDKAICMTLGSDSDIQVALARVRAAEADADQSRLLPNPIINASIRFPFNFGTPLDLAVTEDVSAVLTRPDRAQAADARLRMAVAAALTTVLDQLAQVQERYAAVQSLDAMLPVLRDRQSLVNRLGKLARNRLELQEGTQLDVTTLDAQASELAVEINERQAELRQERLALTRLIGQPSAEADWRVTPWYPLPVPSDIEAAWIASALNSRPEIEAARWELTAVGVEVRLASLAPYNGTFLGGNLSDQAPKFQGGPTFTIPIPIFDHGQFVREGVSAKQLEAEHQFTKARRDVVGDVRKQYAAFMGTSVSLSLTRDRLVPAQRRRQDQAEAAFKAGETDVTALILAQQDYQDARIKLIDLQRKATTNLIRLQRAAGGPGPAKPLLTSVDADSSLTTKPTAVAADPNGPRFNGVTQP